MGWKRLWPWYFTLVYLCDWLYDIRYHEVTCHGKSHQINQLTCFKAMLSHFFSFFKYGHIVTYNTCACHTSHVSYLTCATDVTFCYMLPWRFWGVMFFPSYFSSLSARLSFVHPVQAWSESCSQRKDLTGSWCCMLAWWSNACCWSCWSCSALKLRGCGQRSVPAWMNAGLSACPVRGCTSGGCDRAGGATICLGLLTFVLDLANSNRMVCGRSGSNRTPCCRSCLAASAPARELNVTNPTGLAVFPFFEVTFSKDPS